MKDIGYYFSNKDSKWKNKNSEHFLKFAKMKLQEKKYFIANLDINFICEKPNINKAPSNYAIIGRYILPVNIFDEIKNLKPSQGGEIHITDAIRNLILKGNNFFGNIFKGKYLDCGTINGYIQSSIQIFRGN